jgi:hypothetical protein
VRPLARLQNSDSQQRYTVYTARLLCYYLRVLESVENSTVEMSPDEQTESDDDSEEIISKNGGEAMDHRVYNRGAETITNVFKDARKLFP